MKKPETLIKEYASKLSEDDLKFLYFRFSQRLGGDLPEGLNFLSENYELDRLLSGAKTCDELYDLIDLVTKILEKEYNLMAA